MTGKSQPLLEILKVETLQGGGAEGGKRCRPRSGADKLQTLLPPWHPRLTSSFPLSYQRPPVPMGWIVRLYGRRLVFRIALPVFLQMALTRHQDTELMLPLHINGDHGVGVCCVPGKRAIRTRGWPSLYSLPEDADNLEDSQALVEATLHHPYDEPQQGVVRRDKDTITLQENNSSECGVCLLANIANICEIILISRA